MVRSTPPATGRPADEFQSNAGRFSINPCNRWSAFTGASLSRGSSGCSAGFRPVKEGTVRNYTPNLALCRRSECRLPGLSARELSALTIDPAANGFGVNRLDFA